MSRADATKKRLTLTAIDRGEPLRAARITIRLPLRIRIPSLDFPFESEALNISQSGAFVAWDDLPPVGARVDLEISLTSGSLVLHATGEVVRHQTHKKPRGMGIRFLDVSYEAQALIDRMLEDERLFGRYRLDALIGQGGMAEVYAATVLEGEHAGQTVAIKRILPDLSQDREMLSLFIREAEVTRLLRHPAIVEVLDIGNVGDNIYIAMEYVRGCNLAVILDECIRRDIHIPIDFCLYVAKTVADALDYAHHIEGSDGTPLGLVHRDVTPGNIFISDTGEIKLGDFGVAFVGCVQDEEKCVVGKAPYMAAEVIERGAALPAADLFSLSAVLFELLTNRRAFNADNDRAVWRQIVRGEAPVPSSLRPEIPPAVDALLLRALSPNVAGVKAGLVTRVKHLLFGEPPLRFASAAELSAGIEPLYDPAIGTQMAIASVVRNILRAKE